MFKCAYCGANIKADTDDNYNSSHNMIKCENCDEWNKILIDEDGKDFLIKIEKDNDF